MEGDMIKKAFINIKDKGLLATEYLGDRDTQTYSMLQDLEWPVEKVDC